MDRINQLAEDLADSLSSHLEPGDISLIRTSLGEANRDPDMAIDDCLQFAMLAGYTIPDELMDRVLRLLDDGAILPENLERCRRWIAQMNDEAIS